MGGLINYRMALKSMDLFIYLILKIVKGHCWQERVTNFCSLIPLVQLRNKIYSYFTDAYFSVSFVSIFAGTGVRSLGIFTDSIFMTNISDGRTLVYI